MGFPGGPMVKNLPDHAGATWDAALIPESGRSPKGGNGQLTPAFLPGKFHRQRSLPGLVHGVTKSRTWLSDQACMQHLKILGNITWNENACFQSTVLSEILGLAHLPSELSAVFASITRWAHLLEEAHSILGTTVGHWELEKAQEPWEDLIILPWEGNFMNETFQANDTKLPPVLFNHSVCQRDTFVLDFGLSVFQVKFPNRL